MKLKSRTLVLSHDIPVDRIKRFWDGLAEGKILATRCTKCNAAYYPPRADCSQCLKSEMDWFSVPMSGKIVTFTQVFLKPQGFEQYTNPYFIGVVEVPGGMKLMGWIVESPSERIAVGAKVGITAVKQTDGFPLIAFRVVPKGKRRV